MQKQHVLLRKAHPTPQHSLGRTQGALQREHEGEGPIQAVPAPQNHNHAGVTPPGAPAGQGGLRSPVGFGLLSGMFSNLLLREEVCQRKYVTDCK